METLGMEERLRRKMGRPARVRSIATRFTEEEVAELSAAASQSGLAVREWAREVMLRSARSQQKDAALLTELVALRMLTSMVLRSVAIGERLTPEAYAQILAEVRKGKHETAREVLAQYAAPGREQ